MRSTRKKIIKTVYKDEDSGDEGGDFSDSGSDAKITEVSSSEDEDVASEYSSADEFKEASTNKASNRKCPPKKTQLAKTLIKKINKQTNDEEEVPTQFSIKDLTEADKLLPSILNLSESDSSDDESPNTSKNNSTRIQPSEQNEDIEMDVHTEYKDVWSQNMQIQDNSEEIAKKTFMELEQHKSNIEETKAALQNYKLKMKQNDSDVKDLLAMGEEQTPEIKTITRKPKFKRRKDDSDSDMEDWEEVKETKGIPQQGIQLFVEFPDVGCRKSKKIDVEMMMKRRMNRVKKEYQVYMHKVHVLCWLGHGNYISRILNDQELMAAALSLVPSKECYPGDRVDMKYVEQITIWYKDKLTLKQDKNEDKFKPKAPPLKTILLDLIKKRVVTTKKYLVFIFVAMLRALGLQCRVMFNFVTLPIKPPHGELCSLSTKSKEINTEKTKSIKSEKTKTNTSSVTTNKEPKASTSKTKKGKQKIPQLDGNYDILSSDDEEMQVCCNDEKLYVDYENIMQIDGNDDTLNTRSTRSKRSKADVSEQVEEEDEKMQVCCNDGKLYVDYENIMQIDGNDDTLNTRSTRSKRSKADVSEQVEEEDVSPPKIPKRSAGRRTVKSPTNSGNKSVNMETKKVQRSKKTIETIDNFELMANDPKTNNNKKPIKTSKRVEKAPENNSNELKKDNKNTNINSKQHKNNPKVHKSSVDAVSTPKINVLDENNKPVSSKFFEETKSISKVSRLSRNRSQTATPGPSNNANKLDVKTDAKPKSRTKSAPGTDIEKSKYFDGDNLKQTTSRKSVRKSGIDLLEDKLRVSHKDLAKSVTIKKENDITGDLINIMKNRMKDAKFKAKKKLVKGKIKEESDGDSDYLSIEDSKRPKSDSEDDFKPTKISPGPSKTGRRIDRRVISSSTDEDLKHKKIDVWCEIYVEELEQWIAVDVIKGKIHSTGDLYKNATNPVCYVVGWDNNNYLKDLTRKYVPQYNTVTRKLRAEPLWWNKAMKPYLGPKTARDREEDEYLDRMQLDAPLPKSISEYKNHPLYALKRHLLKFEALYPPDAAILGYVRSEPVYARECVYVCRSRDTWLKEAKVVKLGEQPYKVVKARPKWDRLSNKLITDKPLEVFGPWQVQDYEPPVAENGVVPRNAYGNVELFKECMLPKGTVHIKLPGLNRVAKKLNIDCAPAMTGFDFNGGWTHPVYDGFIVCQEFAEIVTDAWVKDQEDQERRDREKTELRVYGNWKRLIKGLLIRERLKNKYGFEKPATTATTSKAKSKAPRLVVKKK